MKPLGCESLQFLWGDTPEENSKVETYQMLLHIFGDTEFLCCTNLAFKGMARNNSENYSDMAI